MELNEQIKQATEPSANSKQILRNFRDATVAVLEWKDRPKGLDEAVVTMVEELTTNEELNIKFEGDSNFTGPYAHRELSRVFYLNETDDPEDILDKDPGVVTLDVAKAFDVIRKYERVLPESIIAPLDDAIGAFNDAEDIEEHERAARAARELANAFAAIEQWNNYMPADVYNPIYTSLSDWIITGKHFLNNPNSLRAGLPGIFREIFKLEDEE